MNTLSIIKIGRIALHLVCLMRRPAHAQWHLRGILRELHPAPFRLFEKSL